MHFGEIEVLPLHGGNFYLDGGAMFGVVPKTLWEKKAPADERNRIRLAANSLLVRAASKNILVETGNGTKWDPKLRNIYGIQEGDPLRDSLSKLGVASEKVDMVINTHLHFDRAGGNTHVVNGRDVPTFPNAQYVVQRAELEHAMNPRSATAQATSRTGLRRLAKQGNGASSMAMWRSFPGFPLCAFRGITRISRRSKYPAAIAR